MNFFRIKDMTLGLEIKERENYVVHIEIICLMIVKELRAGFIKK